MAAVARQVGVQWSQAGGVMVRMPHSGGSFQHSPNGEVILPAGNVMESGSPPLGTAQATGLAAHTSVSPPAEQEAAGCIFPERSLWRGHE